MSYGSLKVSRPMAESYRRAAEAVRASAVPYAEWDEIVVGLADRNQAAAAEFLSCTEDAIRRWAPAQVLLWGAQARDGLDGHCSPRNRLIQVYLRASVQLHREIPLENWPEYLALAQRIAGISHRGAEAFLRYGVRLCRQLTIIEIRRWVRYGLESHKDSAPLCAFFSGASPDAVRRRDMFRKSALLSDCRPMLHLMVHAFLDRPAPIQSSKTLSGLSGYAGGAATDGQVIYLPETAPGKTHYQLMALHQAALLKRIAEEAGAAWMDADARTIHAEIDRSLVRRLPGLQRKMHETARLPDGYPAPGGKAPADPPPWWGDFLIDLMRAADAALNVVREKARADASLSPEMAESLASALLARGHRDGDELWALLQRMFCTDLASPEPEQPPPDAITRTWPEWDVYSGSYRRDWCLVRQFPGDERPNDFVQRSMRQRAGLIGLTRKQFLQLKPERMSKRKAQFMGDDLDLDALMAAVVDRRAGAERREDVYIHRRKSSRDVAVMFLADISASTDEQPCGRRVIDIQKEALVLMSAALDALGDRYAVYGLRSEGRFRVDMVAVKSFFESFDGACAARLGNLEPEGFTRLGAGIRHCAHLLDAIEARVKLMVILTDGRPYDYEYGDLEYAIADTRSAIDALTRGRIHPFVITSDREGADYLERMAPAASSVVLPRVERLPDLLPRLYKRLTV